MNQKGTKRIPLLIIIAVVLIGAIVYGYFFYGKDGGINRNTNTNNTNVRSDYFTFIPSEDELDTADWNEYWNSYDNNEFRNKGYYFFIKYPKDYILNESDGKFLFKKNFSDTTFHSIDLRILDENSEGTDKLIFEWGKDGFEGEILDYQRIGYTSLRPFTLEVYSEETDIGEIIHYFYYHWCDIKDYESVYHFIDTRTGNLDIDINKHIINTFWILECGIDATT